MGTGIGKLLINAIAETILKNAINYLKKPEFQEWLDNLFQKFMDDALDKDKSPE
jgi:hypothetical protein